MPSLGDWAPELIFRNLGVHGRQFLEVDECGPAGMTDFDQPWPCMSNTELLQKLSGLSENILVCRAPARTAIARTAIAVPP